MASRKTLYERVFEVLIEVGADPNFDAGGDRDSLLTVVIHYLTTPRTVELLLEAGATVDESAWQATDRILEDLSIATRK